MILHNPTDSPVTDYPIQDPESKDVNLWTIKPGETLEFPNYVGSYLLEVYGFLQRIMTQEEKEAEDQAREKINKNKQFSQVKIIPGVAQPIPVETPLPSPGLTTETATQNPTPHIIKCPDPNCQEEFTDTANMKGHFFDSHIQFQGSVAEAPATEQPAE